MSRFASVLATTLVVLAACSRVESPRPTPVTAQFRLAADEATLPLLRALTNTYTDINPYVTFTLEPVTPGLMAERLGSTQMALGAVASLPPATGEPWWVADLALDGVTVIVHPQNPVNAMTTKDARDLFAGLRNQWTDYGAANLGNVEVAVREDGDPARGLFDRVVMGDQKLTLDARVMPSAETMLNYIALNPAAIGYASVAAASRQPGVKTLALDGQTPAPAGVASGSYLLARTLSLIAPREPEGELRKFVAWALGADGQKIAESLGYATVK